VCPLTAASIAPLTTRNLRTGLALRREVVADKIEARYKKGVRRPPLPKSEAAKARRIALKVS